MGQGLDGGGELGPAKEEGGREDAEDAWRLGSAVGEERGASARRTGGRWMAVGRWWWAGCERKRKWGVEHGARVAGGWR